MKNSPNRRVISNVARKEMKSITCLCLKINSGIDDGWKNNCVRALNIAMPGWWLKKISLYKTFPSNMKYPPTILKQSSKHPKALILGIYNLYKIPNSIVTNKNVNTSFNLFLTISLYTPVFNYTINLHATGYLLLATNLCW